ncbi:hypothetical protein ACVWZA_000638 [Sphingomonas sp. UYAg733]
MRLTKCIAGIVLALSGSMAMAEEPGTARLFSYTLIDRPAFEAGYRAHLRWHSEHHDRLVWYAWYVTSGARRGTFVDGTFGTTLAGLDARPDPEGDGADFQKVAGPHATSTGITSWMLWSGPTTGTPLEKRKPHDRLTALFITVGAENLVAFESAARKLTATRDSKVQLSWYRSGDDASTGQYMLLIHGVSPSPKIEPSETLKQLYGAGADELTKEITTVRMEGWRYAPSLSLIPGLPLTR